MMNGSNVITLSAVTTESNHVFESIHDGSGGEHMTDIAYLLTATTLFSIGFFGFFLNLFVIILMCKDMQVSEVNSWELLCFDGIMLRKKNVMKIY